MRISDWSSDVCSSDLLSARGWRSAGAHDMRAVLLAALALLAGCSDRADVASVANAGAGGDLAAAAIAVGVIPDPASTDPTGLYARATDRICVLPAPRDFTIGIDMDYGDGQQDPKGTRQNSS